MKIIQGGKVIASGGFGCLFNPALKCEDYPMREVNKVTKLMTNKNALSEYKEINSIKKILSKIPNFNNYFLLDNFTICKPDKLTSNDLTNFNDKCSALTKDKIDETNINSSLKKLMALNMPYGGIPIDDYTNIRPQYYNYYELNRKLIDLFKNGILEMNKLNIYHTDIKDSNVLVEHSRDTINNLRLIDWGLTAQYKPCKNNKFPISWYNRPLQFNVPFSIIIFTESFVKSYTLFIEDGFTLTEKDLTPFVNNYIGSWMDERGEGHYEFIHYIMVMLFSYDNPLIEDSKKGEFIRKKYTVPIIINYIVAILMKYNFVSKEGYIYMREYLDEVFIHILDIWGFIMIYIPILEKLFKNYKLLSQNQLNMFKQLKKIILVYLYLPRTEKIDPNVLINDLEIFGNLLKNEFRKNKIVKFKIGGNLNNLLYLKKIGKVHKKTKSFLHKIKNKTIKNKR